MESSSGRVSELIEASRKGQAEIHVALAEIHNLLETLRQYRIPEANPDAQDAVRGSRRLSVVEMADEGLDSSHELNSKISRHIQAYELAMSSLRQSVDTINLMGANAPWLAKGVLDPGALATVDPADEEYVRLLAEKNTLVESVSEKNALLQSSIDQLRDMCFVLASLSSQAE